MEKFDVLRDQILKLAASLPDTDKTGFVTHLLNPLKAELQSLISEEGFNVLLSHTIYFTGHHHACFEQPWLESPSASQMDHLAGILERLEPAEAREVTTALILTFIDLLVSMIGDLLTIDILCSAWGKDALGTLGEESQQ